MLQVEHLTKRYGAVTAVDDLSFEIEREGVYGFLGPNGAGKSHHHEHHDRLPLRDGGDGQDFGL